MGASYGQLLKICPHGRVGGAQFVAFGFVDFCDSADYGVSHAGLLELSFFMNETRKIAQVYLPMKNMV